MMHANPLRRKAQWVGVRFETAMKARRPGERNYVSPALEPRRKRIISQLCRALTARGLKIEQTDGEIVVRRGTAKSTFKIREKLKRGRRPLTETERLYNYSNRTDAFALFPTGNLYFISWFEKAHLIGPDEEDNEITGRLVRIVESDLDRVAEIEHRWAQERLQSEEKRRIAEAEAALKKRDGDQWKAFVEAADDWRRNDLLKNFLDALEAANVIQQDLIDLLRIRIASSDPIADFALQLQTWDSTGRK